MLTNFLSDSSGQLSTQPVTPTAPSPEPQRETVRITVTGSPEAVDAIVRDLHSRRFAEVNDWCPPMPTGKINEVIRVLLKRIWR